MKKLFSILSITAAALMLSSCIIVDTDKNPDIVIEKKKTTTVVTDEPSTTTPTTQTPATDSSTPATTTTTTTPAQAPATTHSIICKNETSLTITDWCVKKDNVVTFANSGFTREITPGHEDRIMNLTEGYYVVYFSFEDDYQLNPWDYHSSESIYLDRDITYCLFERASTYVAECRAAGISVAPELYLEGSDGTIIELTK